MRKVEGREILKKGKVFSLNISKKKGEPKERVERAIFRENYGIIGDVHAGKDEKRQVSLLSWERMKEENFCLKKSGIELRPGIYAENITTEGINLSELKIGSKLRIGKVILEVSKIGKECHKYCEIYKKVGKCIMPKEGIFARVIKGGEVKVGDIIEVLEE